MSSLIRDEQQQPRGYELQRCASLQLLQLMQHETASSTAVPQGRAAERGCLRKTSRIIGEEKLPCILMRRWQLQQSVGYFPLLANSTIATWLCIATAVNNSCRGFDCILTASPALTFITLMPQSCCSSRGLPRQPLSLSPAPAGLDESGGNFVLLILTLLSGLITKVPLPVRVQTTATSH